MNKDRMVFLSEKAGDYINCQVCEIATNGLPFKSELEELVNDALLYSFGVELGSSVKLRLWMAPTDDDMPDELTPEFMATCKPLGKVTINVTGNWWGLGWNT